MLTDPTDRHTEYEKTTFPPWSCTAKWTRRNGSRCRMTIPTTEATSAGARCWRYPAGAETLTTSVYRILGAPTVKVTTVAPLLRTAAFVRASMSAFEGCRG